MQSTTYALVDCNNFYVSCERVFDYKLRHRPVVVLSNNDGCAISRSNEAKQIGIKMAEPFFKFQHLIKRHNVAVLSSNFALYGDLSSRVMQIIAKHSPQIEIYSIDEAFINLSSLPPETNLVEFCNSLVLKIEQYTGLPVSIGIGSSRTLAKVANQIAKQQNISKRVFHLEEDMLHNILATTPVRDVWGIGWRCEKKLNTLGIYTAAQLAKASEKTIKKVFNIVMWRTVQELNGISCINLRDDFSNKKNIMVSRSFGYRVTGLDELQQALATYISMAAKKLRKQGSITGGFYVFLRTSVHGTEDSIYKNSIYVTLPSRTNDTLQLIQYAQPALKKLFASGYRYQKVGVILCDLIPNASRQFDIFADTNLGRQEQLMQTIDNINNKFGNNALQFGAAGFEKPWHLKSERKSRNYTGNWQELLQAKL